MSNMDPENMSSEFGNSEKRRVPHHNRPSPLDTDKSVVAGKVREFGAGFGSSQEVKDKPDEASFLDLFNAAYDETDPLKRKELTSHLETRLEQAESKGFFNRSEFNSIVIQNLNGSNWEVGDPNYFYTTILNTGRRMEQQRIDSNPEYRKEKNQRRFGGLYDALSHLVANQTSIQGLRRKFPSRPRPDPTYIAEKTAIQDQTKALREYDRREVANEPEFLNISGMTSIDLPSLVGGRSELEQDAAWGHEPSQEILRNRGRTTRDDELTKLLREIRDETRRQSEAQERATLASMQDFSDFASWLNKRSPVSEQEFFQRPGAWYKRLEEGEKDMVVALSNVNILAYVVKAKGMQDLDAVMDVKVEIKKEDLASLWNNMPGFRIAFSSMVSHIFERETDHFVISDRGYDIIDNFKEYKKQLIASIADYLEDNNDEDVKEHNVQRFYVGPGKDRYLVAALAAVSAADNMLYALGPYHSGDTKRKLTNTDVWAEQPRAFFMPGIKGFKKWVKKEDPGREEDWGGVLGKMMRDKLNWNSKFKKDYELGKNGSYLPERLFFSMFDHEYFNEDYSRKKFFDSDLVQRKVVSSRGFLGREKIFDRNKVSMSQALVNAPTVSLEEEYDFEVGPENRSIQLTLVDYEDPNLIDFNQLERGDLYGDYADTRSHAVAIYKGLTTKDPSKTGLSTTEFIQELNKLREDVLLQQMRAKDGSLQLWNKDLLTIAVALAACKEAGVSGECFVEGVKDPDRILLNIDDKVYDNAIWHVLKENRLFRDMPANFKEHLYRTFYAKDPSKTGVDGEAGYFATRPTLRREAAKSVDNRSRG